MSWIAMICLGGWLSTGLYAWWLKKDRDDADRYRIHAENNIREVAHQLATSTAAYIRQIADLREDIGELEDDLSQCSSADDVRRRISRLLQKAGGQAGNGAPKLSN